MSLEYLIGTRLNCSVRNLSSPTCIFYIFAIERAQVSNFTNRNQVITGIFLSVNHIGDNLSILCYRAEHTDSCAHVNLKLGNLVDLLVLNHSVVVVKPMIFFARIGDSRPYSFSFDHDLLLPLYIK